MNIAKQDNTAELSSHNLGALVELQRNKFRAEGEVTYAIRIDRLKRLKALIVENKNGFDGDYIGGDTEALVGFDEVWSEA